MYIWIDVALVQMLPFRSTIWKSLDMMILTRLVILLAWLHHVHSGEGEDHTELPDISRIFYMYFLLLSFIV